MMILSERQIKTHTERYLDLILDLFFFHEQPDLHVQTWGCSSTYRMYIMSAYIHTYIYNIYVQP
jgi:hypothetical protein